MTLVCDIDKEVVNINNYIMYHCHTRLSLLDSATHYSEYIELAQRDGMKALSFSEHGKPLQWCEKLSACKEAGIKYIHSVEIYLTEDLEEKKRDNYHTVLLAKNMDGLREINALIQKSSETDHFYYVNRISFDEFLALSDNVITTSACLASPLNKLDRSHPRYMELARKYDYFEIQSHNSRDQVEFNKRLSALSKELGTPLIAGTDTHSASEYKAECRNILLKAKHKSYGNEDEFDLTYKTYDELVQSFKQQGALPEEEYLSAIERTNDLYDLCEELELDASIKYPILYGSREKDDEVFSELVKKKFKQKLDSGIIPQYQRDGFEKAIEEEMRVFRKLDMIGFMLSMSELVSWCKEQGMAIGTARGSVGGSRIAYITDIIDLNPETWHTVFSRFANEDREEVGDIDIDVIKTDRPAIFKYIRGRFGYEKTARVASFGTLKAKGFMDDVGRALAIKWAEEHPSASESDNPWSLKKISFIKSEFDADKEGTKKKYPELFYYYDGLIGTEVSQSVHPAGMVISPITLADNYGTFEKDGETCLLLDMDNIHEYTGLVKYDFLVLKTVEVIRDTCRYLNQPYPETCKINFEDEDVWDDMLKSPVGIFQMESAFTFQCLKKFKPRSIFDMSLVTACIRPSGTSYRDDLLSHKIHKNPSEAIDKLLQNNLGYLIYQEDINAFLQQVCGLSGSEADTVRRGIGRKKREVLEAALPKILDGYCDKSDKPRKEAEAEAKQFLQVIEDASDYSFGYNHSIAYCLLGYFCAYYRYYHPLEFLTSFLNNAANDEDIRNGTEYANMRGIKITMPKFGVSKSDYFFDSQTNSIAKGLSSIKEMGETLGEDLYQLSQKNQYDTFIDLLKSIKSVLSVNSRQLDVLIKIDYFSKFGNQRELIRITDIYNNLFKSGCAKKISKEKIAGTPMQPIVERYSIGTTKSGAEAKSYTLTDINAILCETESVIKSLGLEDVSTMLKVKNYADASGGVVYVSGEESDRRKLYVNKTYPIKRKRDGKQIGWSVVAKSIGSGKESRYTVWNRLYDNDPIKSGDIIYCKSYDADGQYFTLTNYSHIY